MWFIWGQFCRLRALSLDRKATRTSFFCSSTTPTLITRVPHCLCLRAVSVESKSYSLSIKMKVLTWQEVWRVIARCFTSFFFLYDKNQRSRVGLETWCRPPTVPVQTNKNTRTRMCTSHHHHHHHAPLQKKASSQGAFSLAQSLSVPAVMREHGCVSVLAVGRQIWCTSCALITIN